MELDLGSWREPEPATHDGAAHGVTAMIPKIDADFLLATAKRIEARAKAIAKQPHVAREVAAARRRMVEYRLQRVVRKLEDA
jgi:hypothetical protein